MNASASGSPSGPVSGSRCCEQELKVTIVRVRRSETAVIGAATVTDYKTRPAAEWGAELATFLRQVGAAHIAATVLLPRRDVIVRSVHAAGGFGSRPRVGYPPPDRFAASFLRG